jgi:hypothetical protein
MVELFIALKPFELVFLAFVIIWGIPCGFGNTYVRFVCFLTDRTFNQSDLGKICDGVFYFSLIVLGILNLK